MKIPKYHGQRALESLDSLIQSTKANNIELVDHLLLICNRENKGIGDKTSQWPLCGVSLP